MIKRLLSILCQRYRKRLFTTFGKDVYVGKRCHIQGNVEVGNKVSIGEGAWFVSTQAKLIIRDNVVIAPNVKIYTGDHPIHVVGKHIIDISDFDKHKLMVQEGTVFDKDVIIQEGCWIGTRAIILKGVTIGKGSVIGAGAIVTKDVPPYSIYVGIPSVRVTPRFSPAQIVEHEKLLRMDSENKLGGKI